MPFDLVDEIRLAEKEWLEHGLDDEKTPLMAKYNNRDCPHCYGSFTLIRKGASDTWRCSQCGTYFHVKIKKKPRSI